MPASPKTQIVCLFFPPKGFPPSSGLNRRRVKRARGEEREWKSQNRKMMERTLSLFPIFFRSYYWARERGEKGKKTRAERGKRRIVRKNKNGADFSSSSLPLLEVKGGPPPPLRLWRHLLSANASRKEEEGRKRDLIRGSCFQLNLAAVPTPL